jgi:hypothetical protein
MKRLACIPLAAIALAACQDATQPELDQPIVTPGFAIVTQSGSESRVTLPSGPQASLSASSSSADIVSWDGIAPNWTALPNPFTTTSEGGITVTGSMPTSNVLATHECLIPAVITPCLDGSFLPGESLLFTNYTTGPLTFSFGSALGSISTQINTIWYGPFSATLTAYGSGGGILGTVPVSGSTAPTHDGTAPVLSFTTAAAGIYSVDLTAVSQYPLSDYDGFFVNQLNLTPFVIVVSIDIKPGSDPNSINCNNENGRIAVAILTTADFDATTVDHTTVTFQGASETHVDRRTGEPWRHEEDVDLDGDIDLVVHLRLGDTDLDCNSTEGTLTGETFDGQTIQGSDAVRMVGGS